MPGLSGYLALLDKLAVTPMSNPQPFLTALREAYDLTHILYADLERQGEMLRPIKLIHDANSALERLISTRGATALTPVFAGLATIYGPTDIDSQHILNTTPGFRETLAAAGLSQRMLAFPLAPSRPGVALFACTIKEKPISGSSKAVLIRDLAALAGLFHAKRLSASGSAPPAPEAHHQRTRLTTREQEVLQWVADGKTYWEIAHILGISERTVRHFMAQCREKLEAVSNKQAVAKAVAGGLIAVRPAIRPAVI